MRKQHVVDTLARVCELWDCLPKSLVGQKLGKILREVERDNVTVYWSFYTSEELDYVLTEAEAREVPIAP